MRTQRYRLPCIPCIQDAHGPKVRQDMVQLFPCSSIICNPGPPPNALSPETGPPGCQTVRRAERQHTLRIERSIAITANSAKKVYRYTNVALTTEFWWSTQPHCPVVALTTKARFAGRPQTRQQRSGHRTHSSFSHRIAQWVHTLDNEECKPLVT